MVAIETPALAAATRSTLFDVAYVAEGVPGYALQNPLKYETAFTGPLLADVPPYGTDKEFQTRDEDTETKVFSTYLGLDDPLLRGAGAGSAELEALFTAGEALFVERKVQELLLSPEAVDITPTPGTPIKDLKVALGLLEQWIATRYIHQPVITGNLLAVTMITEMQPPKLQTVSATPIGVAAGYGIDGPGAAAATATSAWLYISGQINIWKGQASVTNAPDLKGNRDLSLVEKSYAASIDGPAAAILVGI